MTKNVTVEMTEKEMEDLIALRAEKEANPEPLLKEFDLKFEHSINGKKYYRGKQMLEEGIGNMFLYQEQQIIHQHLKSFESNESLVQILGAGVVKKMVSAV